MAICLSRNCVCVDRERGEQRASARARETEAEGRLREANAAASELRAKLRPVEEYTSSDKEEQLRRAGTGMDASKQRLEANDERVKVRSWNYSRCFVLLCFLAALKFSIEVGQVQRPILWLQLHWRGQRFL